VPESAAREQLCRCCKQPFVARHRIATVSGTAETLSRVCPDCAQNMGARPETEMDCVRYIQVPRLGARLRDGYRLLLQVEAEC
jgi:hypothetical protein